MAVAFLRDNKIEQTVTIQVTDYQIWSREHKRVSATAFNQIHLWAPVFLRRGPRSGRTRSSASLAALSLDPKRRRERCGLFHRFECRAEIGLPLCGSAGSRIERMLISLSLLPKSEKPGVPKHARSYIYCDNYKITSAESEPAQELPALVTAGVSALPPSASFRTCSGVSSSARAAEGRSCSSAARAGG